MSKEQLATILELSAQNPPPQGGPIELREWFEGINAATPVAAGLVIESVTIGAFSAEILTAPGADGDKLVIYYHGGGFMMGSPRSHRVIASNLARTSGVAVLSVAYRLAPEHPAPTAHDDAFTAYKWALDEGFDAASLALTGDSAGGNMALATAVRAREAGLPQPAAIAVFSPALDLAAEGESHATDAPLLVRPLMDLFNAIYLGDGDRKSASVTPFYSDLSGLPPTLVHVGTWEILRDDSVTMAERLRAAGVETEFKQWDGMVHSWQLFAPMLDEGMASIEEAGSFLRRHLA
jgi:monoterpene epsilon-lactone hydrolase